LPKPRQTTKEKLDQAARDLGLAFAEYLDMGLETEVTFRDLEVGADKVRRLRTRLEREQG
jgi:hypothetical protein